MIRRGSALPPAVQIAAVLVLVALAIFVSFVAGYGAGHDGRPPGGSWEAFWASLESVATVIAAAAAIIAGALAWAALRHDQTLASAQRNLYLRRLSGIASSVVVRYTGNGGTTKDGPDSDVYQNAEVEIENQSEEPVYSVYVKGRPDDLIAVLHPHKPIRVHAGVPKKWADMKMIKTYVEGNLRITFRLDNEQYSREGSITRRITESA